MNRTYLYNTANDCKCFTAFQLRQHCYHHLLMPVHKISITPKSVNEKFTKLRNIVKQLLTTTFFKKQNMIETYCIFQCVPMTWDQDLWATPYSKS